MAFHTMENGQVYAVETVNNELYIGEYLQGENGIVTLKLIRDESVFEAGTELLVYIDKIVAYAPFAFNLQ